MGRTDQKKTRTDTQNAGTDRQNDRTFLKNARTEPERFRRTDKKNSCTGTRNRRTWRRHSSTAHRNRRTGRRPDALGPGTVTLGPGSTHLVSVQLLCSNRVGREVGDRSSAERSDTASRRLRFGNRTLHSHFRTSHLLWAEIPSAEDVTERIVFYGAVSIVEMASPTLGLLEFSRRLAEPT